MSQTQHPRNRHRSRARTIALITATSFATILAPLAMAPAAQATLTKDGCSATAVKPWHPGEVNSASKKIIRYQINVTCKAGRTILIAQRFWEDDNALRDGNDRVGLDANYKIPFSTTRSRVLYAERYLRDTERGAEEVFHDIRFRVRVGDLTGGRTSLEQSRNFTVYD